MTAEAWVAIYAAVVATGALFLEVRRWVESGPKLVVRATPDMIIIGQDLNDAERDLVMVTVVNRGAGATTLTNLLLFESNGPIWLWRWRMEGGRSFVIPNPQASGATSLPMELGPNSRWTGFIRPRLDVTGDTLDGRWFAAVTTTDRDRPYLARINKRPQPKARHVEL